MLENRKPRRRDAGNAMLEFALIVPVLVLMAFGTADFARVVALKVAIQNAADAAANFLSQSSTQSTTCPPTVDTNGAQTAATNDFASRASGFSVSTTLECGSTTSGTLTSGSTCTCSNSIGTYVQINTSVPFATLGTYPGIPSSVTVNAQAIVRVQ